MPEEIETPASDEALDTADAAEETVAADAGDDTLAAGAGADDTVAIDAGDDTVAAGAADDAAQDDVSFDEFDEPATSTVAKPAKPANSANGAAAARAGSAAADPTDDDLTAIEREAKELDETFVANGKLSGMIKKLADRDRRRQAELDAMQGQIKETTVERQWARFEKQLGLDDAPPPVRKALTRDKLEDRFLKHFQAAIAAGSSEDEARGEARAALKYETKQIIAKHGKSKPRPAVATNKTGSVLRPPGGGGQQSRSRPALSAEDQFDNREWNFTR